ncbi:MAG: CRISPR-associated endoribonuclease Cas6, partial [Anaerovorax sp.]|nr:CRISPR-associated endoribonuclease Cas6 [Anaerovorax sp.]
RQLPPKIIDQRTLTLKMAAGSPLVVRKHDEASNIDTYYSVEDKQFGVELLDNLKRQAFEAGFSETYISSLKVNPVTCKKIVVYNYGIFFDATVGLFDIEGEPILLQHYYQNGIGSKRSAGFGMIDVISTK